MELPTLSQKSVIKLRFPRYSRRTNARWKRFENGSGQPLFSSRHSRSSWRERAASLIKSRREIIIKRALSVGSTVRSFQAHVAQIYSLATTNVLGYTCFARFALRESHCARFINFRIILPAISVFPSYKCDFN